MGSGTLEFVGAQPSPLVFARPRSLPAPCCLQGRAPTSSALPSPLTRNTSTRSFSVLSRCVSGRALGCSLYIVSTFRPTPRRPPPTSQSPRATSCRQLGSQYLELTRTAALLFPRPLSRRSPSSPSSASPRPHDVTLTDDPSSSEFLPSLPPSYPPTSHLLFSRNQCRTKLYATISPNLRLRNHADRSPLPPRGDEVRSSFLSFLSFKRSLTPTHPPQENYALAKVRLRGPRWRSGSGSTH